MAANRQSMDFSDMAAIVENQHVLVKQQLDHIKSRKDNVSVGDMFDMQMMMNKFNQLCELASSMASAMHQATFAIARNVKGG